MEYRTRVFAQAPGSVTRQKFRGMVRLDDTGLTALRGGSRPPFVSLTPSHIAEAEVVGSLRGKGSLFTPIRGSVLRVVTTEDLGGVVVGIVLPTDEAHRWCERIAELRAASRTI